MIMFYVGHDLGYRLKLFGESRASYKQSVNCESVESHKHAITFIDLVEVSNNRTDTAQN